MLLYKIEGREVVWCRGGGLLPLDTEAKQTCHPAQASGKAKQSRADPSSDSPPLSDRHCPTFNLQSLHYFQFSLVIFSCRVANVPPSQQSVLPIGWLWLPVAIIMLA